MTSSFPGVKYRAAHLKYLEQDKANALKTSKGYFNAMMILSPQSITDVQWWYNKNINCSKNNIRKGEPVIEILSDGRSFGWGAPCNNLRIGGEFNLDEMGYHINAKELLAATLPLKTFVKVSDTHVSCYQTTLLLYMASITCTLINLNCVIPYLKFGLGLRIKTFGLLLPTFQEKRTIMQMQNHAKNKLKWNGCLTKNFYKNYF